MLCTLGIVSVAAGFTREPSQRGPSGGLLVLAGAALFGLSKIALVIATLGGHPEKPIAMLAIASAFTLIGIGIVLNSCREFFSPTT